MVDASAFICWYLAIQSYLSMYVRMHTANWALRFIWSSGSSSNSSRQQEHSCSLHREHAHIHSDPCSAHATAAKRGRRLHAGHSMQGPTRSHSIHLGPPTANHPLGSKQMLSRLSLLLQPDCNSRMCFPCDAAQIWHPFTRLSGGLVFRST